MRAIATRRGYRPQNYHGPELTTVSNRLDEIKAQWFSLPESLRAQLRREFQLRDAAEAYLAEKDRDR